MSISERGIDRMRRAKIESGSGGVSDVGDGLGVVGLLGFGGPDRAGPGGVGFGASDDMDVHLPDDVTDAGDVEFGGLKVVGEEEGGVADELGDGGELLRGELMEVFDVFIDLGDDEEPGEEGVVLEEDLAAVAVSEEVAAGGEAGMEGEGHGGSWDAECRMANLDLREWERPRRGESETSWFEERGWTRGGGANHRAA